MLAGRNWFSPPGFTHALATLSTSCLCFWTTRADKWGLQPVVIRRDCFTKEIRRLLQGGNSDEFAGKQCYGPPGTMLDASTEVTGARKAPVALTATAGYSQKPQHDEMEFADHHCRRPKRRVIHG